MALASPLLDLPCMDTDRDRVEAALVAAVRTRDAYLTEIASHLIVAGGKRLRPVMTLAAAQIGNSLPVGDDIISGGIACELVHLGSLYHDDVMDEGTTRRGVETVNAKWGNLQAILAGDFLLSRASEIAASLGTEIAGLLARTIGQLCEGQIEELRHTYDTSRTVPSYLLSIEGKTASLFATAARVGAIVAGHNRREIDALTNYGRSFGMVFQIVDDILDIISTDVQLGKPAGHDM
ncbi:MAG: polyprenyl synthetase family protein, partial [Actinomycetota bacterium]